MLIPAPTFPTLEEQVPLFMLDVKRQRNNVHDFVHLNEVERAVLDAPEMQRLRGIKQLGFAYLVYETAEHSRLAHSIGVCHSAKLLVDIINRNHRIDDEKESDKKSKREPGHLLSPQELEADQTDGKFSPKIRWAQRFCIGLAALAHDLPHPPMSHALEHESSVLVRHDELEKNPQLYQYLFEPASGVAKALRRYSRQFCDYLTSHKDTFWVHPDLAYFVATHCHVRVSRHPR